MYQSQRKTYTPWFFGIIILLLLLMIFSVLHDTLMPFIISAVLAYIFNPLVSVLEKKMPRSIASLLGMLIGFLIILALLLVIVPMLIQQIFVLIQRLPAIVDYVQQHLLPWWNQSWLGAYLQIDVQHLIQLARDNMHLLQRHIQKIMSLVLQKSGVLASSVMNIILLPLLLYYFLLDWKKWSSAIQQAVPRRYLSTYQRITHNLDQVLGAFMRGQILVMIIMGTFYGTGLSFIGLNSGFSIGMVAGVLVFIPYLGAFTGLLLATLAAILQFQNGYDIILVWSVFLLGQLLESYVITPKIVGESIGLSPFWIIFSLMAFGQLLGFVGMLSALPLAAMCLVLLQEAKTQYMNSHFYRRKH